MIKIKHKGDFSKVTRYLEKAKKGININSNQNLFIKEDFL